MASHCAIREPDAKRARLPVAALDGTPVIVSGGGDGTVRVWRLADGTPVGAPITGHVGGTTALAVGQLPGGIPVIVSGGDDSTVRLWRLADGIPLAPPLRLSGSVKAVAVHGNVIITAARYDIAVHEPALPRPIHELPFYLGEQRPPDEVIG